MIAFVFCSCVRYDPHCYICRNGRAAYRAGCRAYKQGRSRHAKHGHDGYGYLWNDGWEDMRNANPNTAARRAKEQTAIQVVEARALRHERATIDRKLKALALSDHGI